MSRRKSSGDQEFGSDSFLDIIANIVGILIILIVMAGVKVARQPAAEATTADAGNTIPTEESDETPEVLPGAEASESADGEVVAQPESGLSQELSDAIAALVEPARETESEAPEDLDSQIAALTLELDELQSRTAVSEEELQRLLDENKKAAAADEHRQQQLASLSNEKQQLTEKITTLKRSLDDADKQSEMFRTSIATMTRRQRYINEALDQIGAETRHLKEVLDEAEQSDAAADRLTHRLSPVGRSVESENELHFRLHQGRIANIPIEGLLERMKSQVSARRSIVSRFHRYEGVAGPVGGFNMQYTVRRESVSPLQALQYGSTGYRIVVAKRTIVPAKTLHSEPMNDALRLGSRFRQILEAADPDTTVTVWLYPQDFRYFAELRELAHNLNLRVAARPLPDGVPIAGSPNGSRSSSQ